jgi:hypothetical protein
MEWQHAEAPRSGDLWRIVVVVVVVNLVAAVVAVVEVLVHQLAGTTTGGRLAADASI